MKIKSNIIDRVRKDEILIAKIAVEVDKSTQTVKKWLKDNGLMTTLYGVYGTIQYEYRLSDKDMFEK